MRSAAAEGEYRSFPEKPDRNARQRIVEVPLFVRCLGLDRRARILEVGCGAGVALPVLHRLCAPHLLAGLDIDGIALTSAAEGVARLNPPVQLIHADVRAIPVRDGFFDAVVDFGTCYHIARPGDALSEIERVLTPGGVLATETKLSQFLSHPIRSHGRTLRLDVNSALRLRRHCGLWMSLEKMPRAPDYT
jgi:SAM-dependent methyltransferase